uniref:Uncharacterized protein n=1 Tax=Setaria italica TaxID=4555 RepID=K3Y0R3_SETIT
MQVPQQLPFPYIDIISWTSVSIQLYILACTIHIPTHLQKYVIETQQTMSKHANYWISHTKS